MTPGEQRALLKIERSLRKDPAVEAAVMIFTRRCGCRRGGPRHEPMSPWHPVLWRAVPLTLYGLIAAVMVIAVILILL